jgi:hypothetical protein
MAEVISTIHTSGRSSEMGPTGGLNQDGSTQHYEDSCHISSDQVVDCVVSDDGVIVIVTTDDTFIIDSQFDVQLVGHMITIWGNWGQVQMTPNHQQVHQLVADIRRGGRPAFQPIPDQRLNGRARYARWIANQHTVP